MNISENLRIQREKEYHNKRFTKEIREPTEKYYKITYDCKNFFKNKIFNNGSNKNVLELGCSKGYFSLEMLDKGMNVTGIDISDVAIEQAKQGASSMNFENFEFYVMDAANLKFPDSTFDKVVGGAILHHLDFENALKNISRVLKKKGSAIFLEPLGYNPFINLYRKFTPNYRTPDEKPLTNEDLAKFSKYFQNVSITYFYLTTLLTVPFSKQSFFKSLVRFSNFIDKQLFKIKFVRKYAWQIVIEVSNPRL